jgi:hypothetical protein
MTKELLLEILLLLLLLLAWDDLRLGACAHERAVTYLLMSRLQWPLTSLT